MLKLKQKDKSRDDNPKPRDPQTKKNQQVLVLAVLVAIAANIFVWNQFVKPHNTQVFDAAVAKTVNEYQQLTERFISGMQASLAKTADEIASIKLQRKETDWGFFKKEGFDLKALTQRNGYETFKIDVFSVESLAPDRIQQHGLSFIDIDMLNKAVKGLVVFPEAVLEKDSSQWTIHWAAPIRENSNLADSPPSAILLAKTTTATLKALLAQKNSPLLQIDLVQDIGYSGQRIFLTSGSGELKHSQKRKVDESFWEVRVLPSPVFKSESFELPLWVMALMAAIVALCCAPVAWLFTRPTPVEVIDEDTILLREKYRKKSAKLPKDDAQDTESPLEMTKQMPDSGVSKNDAIVSESYAVPETIFRAYDIRGVVGEELSFELAKLIGQSIASEVLAAGDKAVVVGYDARSHSPELAHHLHQGIISTGCDVIDAGLVPTPLLNFAVIFNEQTRSGIVVTASHNPKNYNGFKIIINEKSLQDEEVQTIKQRIVKDDFALATVPGEIRQAGFKEDYIDTILADIAVASDVKVVIDAANGAASEVAPALFRDLGCEVVPLFCEFNGEFPNHDPDPCNEANLQALIQKVTEENATMGIALDGDGDRLVVVTPKGKIIWPDQLLMIFVKDVVGRNPGCDVVFDIKSTRHLSQLIASYGGRPVMWKTGHSHIKSKMLETNALLAGEFSGHIFFKERWFGFDDGMYAAARLLEILSLTDETLDDLLEDMPKSVSTPEIKIAVDESEKVAIMQRLIKESQFDSGEKTLIDGIRIDFAKGWGLVRASNTSAALTLRFEGDSEETIAKLKTIFKRELIKIDSRLQLDF